MTIGDRLRKLRMGEGLTTREFAEEFGVCIATVNNWENGHKIPSVHNLKRVALFYDVPLKDLIKYL